MFTGLNPPQLEAVKTLRGPMLVLAGAGSGKTRVVTFRIANLIRHGVPADRILAVTFTNKAAKEMQERITHLLGKKQPAKPQISTFHSHCVRVLRRHIRVLGYPEKFAIYDRGDQESLARRVLREIRVSDELMRPGDLLFQIGQWKSQAVRPEKAATLAGTDKEHLASMGYRKYQKALKSAGAVDFDDLLLLTEDLFEKHQEVRGAEGQLFDHILVDEYQDTNASQYRIIRALSETHRNLCVVGDDDQSIYGWRGAEVRHILRFNKDWPDAKLVRLEMNYRSTAAILDFANTLIAFNKQRHDKVLKAARPGGDRPRILQFNSETDEARDVVADISRRLRQPGLEAKDFAILFRTNEQPRPFEEELRKAKIPYTILGAQSFFDRKEIKDLLCFLRTIDSPSDEVSLRRIINTPPRGIGEKTVQTLVERAVKEGHTLWDVITSNSLNVPANAADAVKRFVMLIREQQAAMQVPLTRKGELAERLRTLITKIRYREEIERQYREETDRDMRMNSVEELVNALAAYENEAKSPRLAQFLDEVALGERDFNNDKEQKLARNAVALMTLHSAKGLEFPHVYMVGLEEGILPHHRTLKAEGGDDVAEERRLCYVGITRAQEYLTISLPLTRMKWGKARNTIPSRFLYEMTGQAQNPDNVRRSMAERRQVR